MNCEGKNFESLTPQLKVNKSLLWTTIYAEDSVEDQHDDVGSRGNAYESETTLILS